MYKTYSPMEVCVSIYSYGCKPVVVVMCVSVIFILMGSNNHSYLQYILQAIS